MTSIKAFALHLKALRAQRGISQRKLAETSGVSYGYISRLEIAMQEPTLGIIEKLARGLQV